ATHKDLRALIEQKAFREDLYFRLAAVEVLAPPLRSRGEDILVLADAFLAEQSKRAGRRLLLAPEARRELLEYDWPGNVRELHHVISRAVILADGERIAAFDLPASRGAERGVDGASWPAISLAEAEARTIQAALAATGGAKAKAARLLGISRTALYEKLARMQRRGDSA
ncbi:MAG: sigma-54-dependent Fis family transcriptional regulator, partial [Myxococcales bacterium]|nr:sigma-54-dependent Fis family transcriptional regulator [Myxococcales bacterium]